MKKNTMKTRRQSKWTFYIDVCKIIAVVYVGVAINREVGM